MSKAVKTISIGARAMWCESCVRTTHSTKSTLRIHKNGTEIQIDHCAECKSTQETEYIKGPSVKIRNKK